MANPNVNQGTLNRIRASFVIPDHPELNVNASNLGLEGISIDFGKDAVVMIDTLTGRVTSPEPYIPASISIHLLKTQNLSNLYKLRLEKLATIGDTTTYPDASTLASFSVKNCAIEKVAVLKMNGTDAGFMVTIGGTYQINDDLFNLV